jgi:GNAT superfamily N-acetyltransferase
MTVELKFDCAGVDWKFVSDTLKRVGMASRAPELHRKAFEASHTTVFAYSDGQLVGFGRAISDGAYQAAVYEMAIVPEFQKRGIGARIMQAILERLPGYNVILYASPGKEDFYRKLGFRKMKTGLALFQNAAAMTEKGFTEP